MADFIVDGASHEEIAGYYQGKFKRSLVKEGAYEAEDFFSDIGEKGKWLFFTAAPLTDSQGNVFGALETLQDITERKLAEEARAENPRGVFGPCLILPPIPFLYSMWTAW